MTCASSAEEGIALAVEDPPDLVLMDVQLPGMDGLAATQALKARPETAAVPIYALTALAIRGDAERILAAGCDGYISKPIRYKQLLADVAQAVGSSAS